MILQSEFILYFSYRVKIVFLTTLVNKIVYTCIVHSLIFYYEFTSFFQFYPQTFFFAIAFFFSQIKGQLNQIYRVKR
jgi:hypothetical protein